MHLKLAAVVVTYNRKVLLQRCLNALLAQTTPLDRIFVVDNASTDGTADILASNIYRNNPHIECQRLPDNIGGAGGFAAGMQRAYEWGADRIWIMDDDATPTASALQALLPYATPGVVPASTLVGEPDGFLYGASTGIVPRPREIRLCEGFGTAECSAVSFVGPLFSRECIHRVGLPRADFFIWFDDLEYSVRATSSGIKIVIVESSKILHQAGQEVTRKRFLWKISFRPRVENWKFYYDARNNIAFLKEHAVKRKSAYMAFSVQLLRRILADAAMEPGEFIERTTYRLRGVWDGMLNNLGRRVVPH